VLLLAVRLIWRSLKRRALKGQGQPHVAAEIGRIRPGAPEEKSWSDCGPITLLWGLLNDFLSFPAPSSREI